MLALLPNACAQGMMKLYITHLITPDNTPDAIRAADYRNLM